jgi:hypothetical protein
MTPETLVAAIDRHDDALIENILTRGIDLSAPSAAATLPTAGRAARDDLFARLIAVGGDPKRATPKGNTLLHGALITAVPEVVASALAAGADATAPGLFAALVQVQNPKGWSGSDFVLIDEEQALARLRRATDRRPADRLACARLLLEAGARPTASDLRAAIAYRRYELAVLLLDHGAPADGASLLALQEVSTAATAERDARFAERLLDAGASLTPEQASTLAARLTQDSARRSALGVVLSELLEPGASSLSPLERLHSAILANDADAVWEAVQAGASLHERAEEGPHAGRSAIELALLHGHVELAGSLIGPDDLVPTQDVEPQDWEPAPDDASARERIDRAILHIARTVQADDAFVAELLARVDATGDDWDYLRAALDRVGPALYTEEDGHAGWPGWLRVRVIEADSWRYNLQLPPEAYRERYDDAGRAAMSEGELWYREDSDVYLLVRGEDGARRLVHTHLDGTWVQHESAAEAIEKVAEEG